MSEAPNSRVSSLLHRSSELVSFKYFRQTSADSALKKENKIFQSTLDIA